jgi:hypothetical protein
MADAEKKVIVITPDIMRIGTEWLSSAQGCEDPFARKRYYEDLISDLLEELAEASAKKQASR